LLQQWNGSASRIANCAMLRINPKMLVNRCEKITYSYAAVRGMFAAPVGGAKDMARRTAAAAEQKRHGVRPVIAPGLHDA